jgi:hypothetical protein
MILSSFLPPVVGMSYSKKNDPLPKPSSWPSRVGYSPRLKASLAIKKQNGCQEKNAKSYLAGIVKKWPNPEGDWIDFTGHSC